MRPAKNIRGGAKQCQYQFIGLRKRWAFANRGLATSLKVAILSLYNIGTKTIFLECFGHNSTLNAPVPDLIDDSGLPRRDISFPHVKTHLGAT